MKPTPKKKQPVKARKMWEGAHHLGGTVIDSVKGYDGQPVFVLPADRAAYDAMAYQVCREVFCNPGTLWMKLDKSDRVALLKRSEQILAAIGIKRPANDAGREEPLFANPEAQAEYDTATPARKRWMMRQRNEASFSEREPAEMARLLDKND